jgi:hypothetical protein
MNEEMEMTMTHIVAPAHGAHPVDLNPLEVDTPGREEEVEVQGEVHQYTRDE